MVYYIQYSYNKARQKDVKKIIRKRTYIYGTVKTLHVSGPGQFKPLLFKDQLGFPSSFKLSDRKS